MLDFALNLLNPDGIARKLKGQKAAIIVLYHDPDPLTFEHHVRYLRKHYVFISLDQLVTAIRSQDWRSIPINALVHTFDDGHIRNSDLTKIFKRYGIRPSIYICSGVVGTNTKFWWEGLSIKRKELLKRLRNKDRLSILEEARGGIMNDKPSALTFGQMSKMSTIVDFQSHSRTHPIVTMLDEDELHDELRSPIDCLAKHGYDVKHFAFPNGDYSDREITYLKDCGYVSGRTTDIGWTHVKSDPFKLKIMGVSDNASVNKLRLQISGVFGWVYHIYRSFNLVGRKRSIKRK